jgi:transcriptional regulator with PAS, ATPase and Fis domain
VEIEMREHPWVDELPVSITVCDADGIITEMNEKARTTFSDDGGAQLIGQNVLDCHPEPARTLLASMLKTGASNCYTIEKAGKKKLIFQSPWYEKGQYRGFVEISIPLPEAMQHFVRDTPSPP